MKVYFVTAKDQHGFKAQSIIHANSASKCEELMEQYCSMNYNGEWTCIEIKLCEDLISRKVIECVSNII